jgi:hypothetical protein
MRLIAVKGEAMDKLRLGISACLLGERVRYDGQHKLDAFLRDTLGRFVAAWGMMNTEMTTLVHSIGSGRIGMILAATLGLAACALAAPKINPGAPAPYTGTIQSSKLYTVSDAPGGISGRIVSSPSEVLGIFAVSREKLKVAQTTKLLEGGTRTEAKYRIAVHIAHLSPDNAFTFAGLQEGIFDLFVLLEHDFYTGIVLNRRANALTPVDIKTIQDKVGSSNPYFNEKHFARISGATGRAAKARALVQELRTLPITLQSGQERPDLQTRSIKLVLMEDVSVTGGPAWAVEETRELLRQEVGPGDTKGAIPEYFCKAISGILVIDKTEDLGDVVLKKDTPP